MPAAVLLPLFDKEGHYHLLLTKRTQHLAHHKGQICFPGGACQPEDQAPLTTALREAAEELGLLASDVEVLGRLDDTSTLSSNFLITPFVGVIPYPYRFLVNGDEIEELIEIPLIALLSSTSFYEGSAESSTPGPCYRYGGHVIWGATARILGQFLGLLPEYYHDAEPTEAPGQCETRYLKTAVASDG
ncbi:MAG: CoA pyrophosphatase [Chloroflexi bacterium]|nr:CoA pyrophosphatase [Chloroflexota bacterium]